MKLDTEMIKYWMVLIMSLPHLLSTTNIINCDDRYSPQRLPTNKETRFCYDNHNRYNSYDPRYYNHDCNSYISDLLDTTCTALSLESNDVLNINAKTPKVLFFNYSFIKTIPSRLFEKYPSLQKIYINDSYVTEIDLNAFAGLTHLEELDLQNNRITEIGKGTFNSLINLITLDISNNQIGIIEKKSFHGLTHLEILNINNNKILNVSDSIFDANLHSLRVLNVSHNFISMIELTKMLSLFSNAEQNLRIDLSYNALKSFNFSQLTLNLDTLNLNNNNLETLGDLKKSIAIKYLDISNNRLSKFSYSPENITYLNLSGNLLQNFNTSFSNRSKIETLDLGRNLIKSLHANTFDNMSSLTNLCLKDNQLVDLPIGLFKNLKHLLILSLAGNHFKQFEFGIFSRLSDLLEFDISNNSFSDLNYKTFYSFKNLTVLNIANNDLVTLNPYDILNHCEKLEMVILNDNPWDCVSLLNFTLILNKHNVMVMEGSNMNIKNHQGHACRDNMLIENSDKKIGKTDNLSIKNEVNDLTKFFEFEFGNSSFFHYFENYKNRSEPNFDVFNEYFNKDFKNTSFYNFFNKNISTNFPTTYDESFRNLTDTLNLLNLKLSNLNQSTGLPSSNQINLDKLSEVLSNFSNYFDSKFKSSNFYKVFDKNFTNPNELNKPTVDLLNSNLEKLSKSVDSVASIVAKESSFYRIFQTKFENGSFDQFFIKTTFPEKITSNISQAKLTGASDERNQDIAQQIGGLRGSFIAFMAIIIILLVIAIMLPILKKFTNPFSKNSKNRNTFESTADLPLV